MKTRILILGVAAVVGVLIGFAWHGRGQPARVDERDREVSARTPPIAREEILAASRPRVLKEKEEARSSLADQLERDLSMSSGVIRWLHWLEAIERATPDDFIRLVRMARDDASALELIGTRWVEIDPRHLFDTLRRSPALGDDYNALARVLFREWTRKDPEAVIAALNETEPFGQLRDWRMRVATRVFDADVERGLQLFSDWVIHEYGPRMTHVASWAAADPLHAAQVALKHTAGFTTEIILGEIGKQWARTAPSQALDFAARVKGKFGSVLSRAVLKEWTSANRNEAAGWLASADPSIRNRLSPSFVEAWAASDAEGALTWCEANLSGRSLADAVGGVLRGAAARDLARAAELVEQMRPSAARAEAALAVAEKWLPEFGSESPVAPEAIVWLEKLDSHSLRRVLERAHWQWTENDPETLLRFLETRGDADIPRHVYVALARTMARKDPLATLEWVNRLAPSQQQEAGATAFVEWRRAQPDRAMQWLRDLPNSDSRRRPFLEQTVRSLAHESEATAAALLAGLPQRDRDVARGVLMEMQIPSHVRQTLLDALKTPSP